MDEAIIRGRRWYDELVHKVAGSAAAEYRTQFVCLSITQCNDLSAPDDPHPCDHAGH